MPEDKTEIRDGLREGMIEREGEEQTVFLRSFAN